VMDLIDGQDVVVDASDNFPTRFLLNDACTLAGIPLSHGAVYRFEGQVTTFTGGQPCYRCLFPEAPPADAVPDCATAGVLGVVPGTVGAIQATEVVKLILDEGETLDGRLLVYDARDLSTESVPIRANPDCPVCGTDPVIQSVEDGEYSERCAVPGTN
jgi:molybdopterin/thiamine biosynthesis adenylyltransferase